MREHKKKLLRTLNKDDLWNEIRSVQMDILEIKTLLKKVEMKTDRLHNMSPTKLDKILSQ